MRFLPLAAVVLVANLAVTALAQPSPDRPKPAARNVWPGAQWTRATPESQGFSTDALDAAVAYARAVGGGSGCIIRRGYLVKEWGDANRRVDIKSATKGSVGTTLLGLAFDTNRVRLDDPAADHDPAFRDAKPGESPSWRKQITIRQLATMTAGFDDGRPPRLVYRPGTQGIYSNDGANMLAELLTRKFGEDLASVFRREVMEPIGASADDWSWRENAYRSKTLAGIKSREFASGITITPGALARIGYLYLHGGEWNGRRILSREYIQAATRATDLPAFVPYYTFFWGSNSRGTFPDIPRDAFWALGLGDSFVFVCPSLDLVAVRLGVGSVQSQLPGPSAPDQWGKRVEGFARLIVAPLRANTPAAPHQTTTPAPYPPSPRIVGLVWSPPETIVRKARGSDNWPLTWADDDDQYTAYGDGHGFEPQIREKLSLGFTRVSGNPPAFTGINVRSPGGEQRGGDKKGPKASGMLMVDGVLYLWTRNSGNARLARSKDHAQSWEWSDWKFTTSFGYPTFLNFGKNYQGARDDYVYTFSHDQDSAYERSDRMVLARVSKNAIMDRNAYTFLEKLDDAGQPCWTTDIDKRGAVFSHAGQCYRSAICYDAGLKRYLWCQTFPGGDPRFRGGFGIFDAPEPWGPWTTVSIVPTWDVGPGETSSFPTKWISPDGKTLYLVFSGDDSFSVRKCVLKTSIPAQSP